MAPHVIPLGVLETLFRLSSSDPRSTLTVLHRQARSWRKQWASCTRPSSSPSARHCPRSSWCAQQEPTTCSTCAGAQPWHRCRRCHRRRRCLLTATRLLARLGCSMPTSTAPSGLPLWSECIAGMGWSGRRIGCCRRRHRPPLLPTSCTVLSAPLHRACRELSLQLDGAPLSLPDLRRLIQQSACWQAAAAPPQSAWLHGPLACSA